MVNLVSWIPKEPQQLVTYLPQYYYPQNLVYMENFEQWDIIQYRDIKQNMYAISTYGRVKNIITGQILKQTISNAGYYRVVLRCTGEYNNRNCGTFLVHRLIMITFSPIKDYKNYTVNHHDCNKLDNSFFNLEWMTQAENNRYKYLTHTDNSTGEQCKNATITNNQAKLICEELDKGSSYKEIVNKLGIIVKDNNDPIYDIISNIKRRITWKDISKNYSFKNARYSNTNYTLSQLEYICQCIKNNIDIKEIYENLYNKPYINSRAHKSFYETVRKIKNKQELTDISDKYF